MTMTHPEFKTYEELKTKLDRVLGRTTEAVNIPTAPPKLEEVGDVDKYITRAESNSDEDEDDTMSYFEKLAAE